MMNTGAVLPMMMTSVVQITESVTSATARYAA